MQPEIFMKVRNGVGRLFIPQEISFEELDELLDKLLQSDVCPGVFVVRGEEYSYADLTNSGVRKVLWCSL